MTQGPGDDQQGEEGHSFNIASWRTWAAPKSSSRLAAAVRNFGAVLARIAAKEYLVFSRRGRLIYKPTVRRQDRALAVAAALATAASAAAAPTSASPGTSSCSLRKPKMQSSLSILFPPPRPAWLPPKRSIWCNNTCLPDDWLPLPAIAARSIAHTVGAAGAKGRWAALLLPPEGC